MESTSYVRRPGRPARVLLQIGAIVAMSVSATGHAAPGDLELISVDTRYFHTVLDLSYDARYALLLADTEHKLSSNGLYWLTDVVVRDRQAGVSRVASVSSSGQRGNDWSYDGRITPDGRYVVFTSRASNLVPDDTNAHDGRNFEGSDVFVHDMQTGTTTLVSIAPNGQQPDGMSQYGRISDDGRFVTFSATGTNIAGGTGEFIRDRQTGTTTRLFNFENDQGSRVDDLSGDGRYVLFTSFNPNLVPNDTNGRADVFVKDRQTGAITRVSILPDGSQTSDDSVGGEISADGHFAVFTYAYGRAIYARDLWTGTTVAVSVALDGASPNGMSGGPSISADGRYVQFESYASNLVAGDTNNGNDVFRRDLVEGTTELVSRNSSGEPAGASTGAISGDGRFAGFNTVGQLVPGDTDLEFDAYLYEAGGGDLPRIGYTVKPASLDFGPQALGTRRTLSFWLRNKGGRVLNFEYPGGIFLKGRNVSEFTLTNGCGKTVAVGASCRLSITFHPTSLGDKVARLRVRTVEGVERTRPITGTGVAATP